MDPIDFVGRSNRRGAKKLFILRLALVVCMVALAMPALAAGDRAVRSRAMPMYPEIAKRMKIFGLVKIEATVDADGKVTAVKTLEGNRILSTAAEEAVRKTRFAPGAGESTEVVDIDFPRVN